MEKKLIKRYSEESGEIPKWSYGGTPVIDIINIHGEFGKFLYDTIIIDASTILRNIISDNKDIMYHRIKELMNIELDAFIQAITSATKNSGMINVKIVVFLSNYKRALPSSMLKEKLNKLNHKVQEYVLHELGIGDKNRDIVVDDNTLIVQRMLRTGQVVAELKDIVAKARNTQKILLLSHMPYAYHLATTYPNMHVIYSHTGEIHTKDSFPKKVFKNETMPFYMCTHMFFGDSIFLKGEATLKQKRIAKQKAIDYVWITHTNNFVSEELNKILKH